MTVHTDELYQQVILEHNRKPRNYAELEHPSHAAEGYNPLCGDHLFVYLQINAAGVIDGVSFEGDGCAISKALASLMTATLKGCRLCSCPFKPTSPWPFHRHRRRPPSLKYEFSEVKPVLCSACR